MASDRAPDFKRKASEAPTDRGLESNDLSAPRSLSDLAEEQGVGAIFDLDELAVSWPEGEEFDDALDELLQHRIARRAAHKRDPG